MTRVVAVGFEPTASLERGEVVAVYPQTLGRDDLEPLVDAVGDALADGRPVLAIHPTWWPEPARQRLQTLRSLLASPRLATYACTLPPVAGAVLCSLAAALGDAEPASDVVSGLPALERSLLPVARLPRVGGLEHPAPSLVQHALSLWPTTAFGVSWWPEPAVVRLGKKRPGVPVPSPAAWTGVALSRVAVSAPTSADASWLDTQLIAPLGGPRVHEVEPPGLQQRFWGTDRVVEACAFPGDLGALRGRVVEGAQERPCTWCGAPNAASSCPFCGAVDQTLLQTTGGGV